MGADQPIRRDPNTGGIEFEPVTSNKDDLKKYQKDAPQSGYAKLSTQRPKLLPEVEDTIKNHKSSSRASSGSKLPTFELLKNPGVYYEGEWKNGKQNGRGIARGINGTYLEAFFLDGKAEGSGFHVYPDGSYYSGDFKNGLFNGKGKFFYKLNKMTYEGEWKDGKPHGKGEENFPGIGEYEGYFQNGLKHGKGKMVWKDGSDRVYEGDFAEGYMHGEGVLKKDKGYFKGRFDHNNKISGAMKTELGEYAGPFLRGEMSGRGKFTWYNGNVYDGDFKYNKMHGNGAMTLKNGQKFAGVWDNGVNVKINQ